MTADKSMHTPAAGRVVPKRRALLRGIAAAGTLDLAAGFLPWPVAAAAPPTGFPFSLGVASGDPWHDGFVIWTRIAPKPLERDGGLSGKPVDVEWTIARDESMRQVIRRGKATARAEWGYAVHVEIGELDPAKEYFYRFTGLGEQSTVGRAKTLPLPGAQPAEIRFAAAGCQKYEDGYYTAWRHIAAERLDFVFHYGDYIYEYQTLPGRRKRPVIRTLPVATDECVTLEEYRERYAAYKLDPDLQAAHASAPFIVSFDDHEVENNFAGRVSAKGTPPKLLLKRRAAAFQAWYENMPLRPAQRPQGPDILAYRRFRAGDLLTVDVLDTRQYRSGIACGGGTRASCREALEPERTMLGSAQERWLHEGLRTTRARWTLLAQQVPIMRRDYDPDPEIYRTRMDKWDGAVAARDRLFNAIEEARVQNLVVVTGDVHHNCVGELKKNFSDENSATLGIEFIGTSITSGGDGSDTTRRFRALLEQDPHIKFYNNQRGYVRHVVTPERWQADFRVLDKVSIPEGRISTRRSFVIEAGRPGVMRA